MQIRRWKANMRGRLRWREKEKKKRSVSSRGKHENGQNETLELTTCRMRKIQTASRKLLRAPIPAISVRPLRRSVSTGWNPHCVVPSTWNLEWFSTLLLPAPQSSIVFTAWLLGVCLSVLCWARIFWYLLFQIVTDKGPSRDLSNLY